MTARPTDRAISRRSLFGALFAIRARRTRFQNRSFRPKSHLLIFSADVLFPFLHTRRDDPVPPRRSFVRLAFILVQHDALTPARPLIVPARSRTRDAPPPGGRPHRSAGPRSSPPPPLHACARTSLCASNTRPPSWSTAPGRTSTLLGELGIGAPSTVNTGLAGSRSTGSNALDSNGDRGRSSSVPSAAGAGAGAGETVFFSAAAAAAATTGQCVAASQARWTATKKRKNRTVNARTRGSSFCAHQEDAHGTSGDLPRAEMGERGVGSINRRRRFE